MAEYKGIIESNCAEDNPRTGTPNCDRTEGNTVALLITGRNAYYPLDKDTFVQGLDGYITDTGVLKMWPVKNIVSTTINGGDINAPDLGNYGGAAPTNLNAKNEQLQIDAGDCLYKELTKFNKRKVRVFRVDNEGFVYGTVVTRDGMDYFAGFEATLYVQRVRTDGSTANNLSLFVYYTTNNEVEERNMQAISVGDIPEGLIGIMLNPGTDGTATVTTSCGGEDITALYGDDWTPGMFVNGAGANPTSVTFDSATGKLTIAPAGSYKIAGAAILAAGDIPGYDGVDQYVTITSVPNAG